MSDLTREIDATVAALAADPAAAVHLGGGRAVLVLSVPPDRVLWSSPSAADLRATISSPDGSLRANFPALARLRVLAGELQSDLITVVERIRLRPEGDDITVAFRRLHLSGGDALLAALVRRDDTPVMLTDASSPAIVAASSNDARDEPDPTHRAAEGEHETLERVRRQGLRRFIWSTDRSGRFTSVSPPLAEVVGEGSAAIVGRLWSDLVDGTVMDEGGVIASCIARRATWSNETVLWRIAGTGFVVPVELGGMPIFGRGHELDGYRGFGLCRSEEVRPGPPPSAPRTTPAVAADLDPSSDELTWSDREPAPATSVAALPDEPEPETDRPILSVSEKGALREIARALGAKMEADEEGETPSGSADILPMARPGRAPDLVRVLDRLPVGILAIRGETPIFINRCALDLLDYPDLATLLREGGASRIFTGRLGHGRGLGSSSATPLVTRSGRTIEAEVRLTTVEWGEQAASAVVIRALPAPVEPLRAAAEIQSRDDERLREAERILDLTGVAVATLDEAGRIVSLNGAAETLFGRRTIDVAGESGTALIAAAAHPAAIALLAEARRAGPDEPGREIEVAGRGTEAGGAALLMRVGRISGGEGTRFCMLFRDVSAFRRTERELDEARRSAEDESARRAEFLARVSHEIRTPLNAIIGFAELMTEERFGPIGNERYRTYLKDIRDSGAHVVSLVNDLLDLAKVTSGKIDLAVKRLDVGDIASDTVAMMQGVAQRERIVLRASFAPGLPKVPADERSIRQVVINLLANAVRFTPAGGQVIVSTSLTDRGEVALRVRDTGVGMSPDEVETALKPFRQLSTAGRNGGTGLGLPLSKALTEANGGSFAIRSTRGSGTLIELVFAPARPD